MSESHKPARNRVLLMLIGSLLAATAAVTAATTIPSPAEEDPEPTSARDLRVEATSISGTAFQEDLQGAIDAHLAERAAMEAAMRAEAARVEAERLAAEEAARRAEEERRAAAEREAATRAATTTTAAPAVRSGGSCGGWEGLIAAHFPADQVAKACRVMMCESGGNPDAKNARSSASGLFQFLDGTWESTTGTPAPARAYSPDTQVAAAATLWRSSGWSPWMCA